MWSQWTLGSITMSKASWGDRIPVELCQIQRRCYENAALNMPVKWKTQQWPQYWKMSVFIPIPKKGNDKECLNYCTVALISHASKVMPKFSKPGFNCIWTVNFQMFKLDLERAQERKKESEVSQLCLTLCNPMDCSLHHGIFHGKSTGVGCHFLLQGIFPTQGWNPGLQHCKQMNQWSNCQHPLDHWKSMRVPEKHLLLLYWLSQSFWLCGSRQTVENSSRDENSRPPDLLPEKSVCKSKNWTWNNRLVPGRERSMSRLYIVTLLI